MTPSHLATLFSLFILLVGAAYVFARPDEVMAADREFPMVSRKVDHGAKPLQIAQADRSSKVAASRKEVARSHHLVILFHGVRGRGSMMEAIGNSWKETLPYIVFVAPDAPFPHRSGGRQWFAVDDQVMRPERIDAARQAFDKVVFEIVQRQGFEGELNRVAFVGVSQGAIMALDAVASGRWNVGALVTFAGLLPLPPTSSSPQTRILMMHGTQDKTIPPAATSVAASQLESAGFNVTSKIYPGVGHTISSQEARDAVMFLRDEWN